MIIFNLYPEGKKKALTMSYDDGTVGDKKLIELFNKYGIKGTFHLNSARYFNANAPIKLEELAELYNGHEISCHTYDHPFPNTMPRESLIRQIVKDREVLEGAAGYPVRGMSYPYGQYNGDVIAQFRALGMEYSRSTRSTGGFGLPEDFMQWHPTCHHRDNIFEKLETFKNPPRGRIPHLMLFYVWGHSYEFDQNIPNNNWEYIEKFCAEVSGMEEVWYATNIEIYDYLNALKALRFNIAENVVYNPSAIPCWFTSNGKEVKVEPGETLRF